MLGGVGALPGIDERLCVADADSTGHETAVLVAGHVHEDRVDCAYGDCVLHRHYFRFLSMG